MKNISSLVSLFLHLVSTSVLAHQSQQPALRGNVVTTEIDIKCLLAAHDGDPVKAMQLVDPAYAETLDEPRLLQVPGRPPAWMKEGDKLRLSKQGLPFVDLTGREHFRSPMDSLIEDNEWPRLRYQERINTVIQNLKVEEMEYNLGNLTSFYNRYYRSSHGAQSSRWVYAKVLEIIAGGPTNVHLSLEAFTPKSVSSPALNLPTEAPGADDGGPGTVTILEAFRALVHTGFRPQVPVEFHWYAAEEGGLLGSQDVASEYMHQRKDVRAMIQFDMTAYVHDGVSPSLTFITNNVHATLTLWAMALAKAYSSSWEARSCCGISDRLSWHRAGIPVICATEADPVRTPNPYIHTADDRMVVKEGEFSFTYALEFVKVAVGFAVEPGGWED